MKNNLQNTNFLANGKLSTPPYNSHVLTNFSFMLSKGEPKVARRSPEGHPKADRRSADSRPTVDRQSNDTLSHSCAPSSVHQQAAQRPNNATCGNNKRLSRPTMGFAFLHRVASLDFPSDFHRISEARVPKSASSSSNLFSAEISPVHRNLKKVAMLLCVLMLGVGNMWGEISYYTPTAETELIYLVSNSTISTHAAIGNTSGTFTTATGKTCGDPTQSDHTKTVGSQSALDLKQGNSKKTLVLNISGCSAVELFHDKNSNARHIRAVLTPSSGTASTLNGTASTNYTKFDLDGTKSYSILFTGMQGTTDGGDVYVSCVRLTKASPTDPVDPTCTPPATALAFTNSVPAAMETNETLNLTSSLVSGGNGSAVTFYINNTKTTTVTPTTAGEYTLKAVQEENSGTCGATITKKITVTAAKTYYTVGTATDAKVEFDNDDYDVFYIINKKFLAGKIDGKEYTTIAFVVGGSCGTTGTTKNITAEGLLFKTSSSSKTYTRVKNTDAEAISFNVTNCTELQFLSAETTASNVVVTVKDAAGTEVTVSSSAYPSSSSVGTLYKATLDASKKYSVDVRSNTGSSRTIIGVAFKAPSLPSAATPSFDTGTQPVGATYTEGDNIAALTAAATISDGGTVSYEWFKKATEGDDTKVGTGASYTPTAAGTYYCVATNKLADHNDATAKSNEVTITINPKTYTYSFSSDHGNAPQGGTAAEVVLSSMENVEGWDFTGWTADKNVKVGNETKTAGTTLSAGIVTLTDNTQFTAQWQEHQLSSDATLSDLKVDGKTIDGFAAGTLTYDVELPFGTTTVPTVTATKHDELAKEVSITQASAIPGTATIVVTAENGATQTYTINFTAVASKVINLVYATGKSTCVSGTDQSAVVKSDDAKVSPYIQKITFENVEGDGDNGAEGSSLNAGKKAGNQVIIQTQLGYVFTNMSFFGKIESSDSKILISTDGGKNWADYNEGGTGSDAKHCDAVSGVSTGEIRLKNAGTAGFWIRNMQLTIEKGCAPSTLSWTAEPADFQKDGNAPTFTAKANNGKTVTYSTSNEEIATIVADGKVTAKALGTVAIIANAAGGDGEIYCEDAPEQLSKEISIYYLVKFDAQGGDITPEDVKYTTTAIAEAPSAGEQAGYKFNGWWDAAEGGNPITFPYIPATSGTLYAQWESLCEGPTITTQPVGANYLIGRTATNLLCEATPSTDGLALAYQWYSSDTEDGEYTETTNEISTATASSKYYYCIVTEEGCAKEAISDKVLVTVAPKDGICITKTATTGSKNQTITGVFGDTEAENMVSLASDKKLGGSPAWIGVALVSGQKFAEGDIINVHTTTAGGQGNIAIYSNTGKTATKIADLTSGFGVLGDNKFALPAGVEAYDKLYICRTDANDWNGYVDFVEVFRPMMPEITQFTVKGIDATIEGTTITATVPYSTTIADIEAATIKYITNDNEQAVLTQPTKYVFGSLMKYVLTDKDNDATEYSVTLTKAAASSDATLGTLTVDGKDILVAEQLAYNYELLYGATTAVIEATPNYPAATVTIDPVTSTSQRVKIVVKAENGTKKTYTVQLSAFSGTVLVDLDHKFTADYRYATSQVQNDGEADAYYKFSGNLSTDGINDLTRYIAYDTKTDATEMTVFVTNGSTSNRSLAYRIVYEDGTAEDQMVIALTNKESKSEKIDVTGRATIYFYATGSSGDVHITQIYAKEKGTAWTKACEYGYTLNLNKGRVAGKSGAVTNIDGGLNGGIEICPASNYAATVTEYSSIKTKGTNYIKFTLPQPTRVALTCNSSDIKFYLADSKDGTTITKTNAANVNFVLDAGTWYINPAGTDLQITSITFLAPDHSRLGMKLEDLGTICLPYNVPVANQYGAAFFKIDYQDGSFVHFIEETGELQAGMPYVFQVTGKDVALFSGEEHIDAPLSEGTEHGINGMIGTFIDMWPADYSDYFENNYYMINTANNHITLCGANCGIYANRAYFDVEGMPTSPQQIEVPAGQAAPRRLVLGRDKANTPTNDEAIFYNGEIVQKLIINNRVCIIRDGVVRDVVGIQIR